MLYQFLLYSKVNQLYEYIYPLFFRFPSHLGHHRSLSRVPCAKQQVLISYLFYMQQCVYVNLKILIHPPFLIMWVHVNFFLQTTYQSLTRNLLLFFKKRTDKRIYVYIHQGESEREKEKERERGRQCRYTGTPYYIVFCRYCGGGLFYKLKAYVNPTSSKSIDTIFPTAYSHFISLGHILVILAIF